jgi:hypothetical protein
VLDGVGVADVAVAALAAELLPMHPADRVALPVVIRGRHVFAELLALASG